MLSELARGQCPQEISSFGAQENYSEKSFGELALSLVQQKGEHCH